MSISIQGKIKHQGFGAIEVLLALSVIALLAAGLVGALIYGQESTSLAGRRNRAWMLSEEGLEATRNIRDSGFTNLTDGTYGLAISANQWVFSGSSDLTENFFTRAVTISSNGTDSKKVESSVTWQQNPQRVGSVILITHLTNWKPF